MPGPNDRLRQVAAVLRDEGPRRLALRGWLFVKNVVCDSGDVVWVYRSTDPATFPPGQELLNAIKVEPGTPQAEVYESLRPLVPWIQERRERAGGERWLFYRDDPLDPIFITWLYFDHAIASEQLDINLPLPPRYAQLEDAYIPTSKRGDRLSAFAIATACKVLRDRGRDHFVSKIDAENVAALTSIRLQNWEEFAHVHGRIWFRRFASWQVEELKPLFPPLRQLMR